MLAEHFADFVGVLAEPGLHRQLDSLGERIATLVAFANQLSDGLTNIEQGILNIAHLSSRHDSGDQASGEHWPQLTE